VPGELRASLLGPRDRDRALERLRATAEHDLLLTELVAAVGRGIRRGEVAPEIVTLWRGREIASFAAVRPTVVLAHDMPEEGIELVLPFIDRLQTGLLKSGRPLADALWSRLEARGRSAMVDRTETAYRLTLGVRTPAPCPAHRVRPADAADLEDLVFAARASLREEQRPDPFDGDPTGFRRWVLSRVPRARVVDLDGRPRFVAYADVRRPEGWLVQGVYTWPEARRKGLARSGMLQLVEEARVAGASHIQLAVVDGNDPAIALYEALGFEAFDSLRTVLFA
jgi:ribosomal protein S18 acetylase RimI-like enzyme